MTITRKLVGGLIGLVAIAHTGCAALGVAMIGTAANPGKPLDTATLDPSIPTVGAPTEPGNGAVSLSVTLPGASAYRTQYVMSELTQIVIGLVDLNSSVNSLYFGYVGTEKANSAAFHLPLAQNVLSWTMTNPPSVAERINFNRYLYYVIPAAQAGQSMTRTVAFTNIKPGTRVVAFAAAYVNNGNTANDVAGFAQTATDFTTIAGTNTIAAPLNLTLNRNLGQIDGTVTITPATPSASAN